jgi:hypothetical protein
VLCHLLCLQHCLQCCCLALPGAQSAASRHSELNNLLGACLSVTTPQDDRTTTRERVCGWGQHAKQAHSRRILPDVGTATASLFLCCVANIRAAYTSQGASSYRNLALLSTPWASNQSVPPIHHRK